MLFTENRPGYSDLAIDIANVHQTVLESAKFKKFAHKVDEVVDEWFAAHRSHLAKIDENTKPAELIGEISDDLLARFKSIPLLDEYDVYEQLMTYWNETTMHDDVFMIMNDGWLGAAKPRKIIEDKDRKLSETPDLVMGSGRSAIKYKMDLVPLALMVSTYYYDTQAQIDELTARAEAATQAVEEYVEEHAVEDGLLAAAMDEDKITKALAAARLRVVKREKSDPDEIKALEHLIKLYDADAAAKKAVKDVQAKLDAAVLKEYGNLTEDDVNSLVLDEKWHATVRSRIAGEVTSLAHNLVARIQQLGERYAQTVSALDSELADVQAKVAQHLLAMGVK
ncbi:hypothetical protein OSH39_24280 [Mycobacterium ulcerans]|uniref:hypothetical protein n=1 Tax=Mycobacterium ulcerans TaxID=1809 RepID=UPI00031FB213|nr:hypothetical protein [Mycobacterium ulcerans]MEB3907143.1 hypothetical protein [Mycobacterium ulcerans]MEB3911276.1 hypothetical protein [Mycobacterium ulcerans]MEB3921514.1 hypothetical protein [Mycobacterium ulcerans]MEB3925645.1 hypothetical protein [Mycobacterium ulcerans]MEB3929779.1 hypothetical protein [Mycobacterium ulcerans]